MARLALWRPASRWVKSEWVPLSEVILRVEDYVGDTREKPLDELGLAWDAAVAELQQFLLAGKVRSSAHLYPEQGKPAMVTLTRAFWQRFRIRGFNTSGSVLMDDLVKGKEARSPGDWRLYLHAADLGRVYPLGPTAAAAQAEARVQEPVATEVEAVPQSERKMSRVRKALLEEIKAVCGVNYGRLRTSTIQYRIAKARRKRNDDTPLESRDTFDRALGRRID